MIKSQVVFLTHTAYYQVLTQLATHMNTFDNKQQEVSSCLPFQQVAVI